MKGYYFYCVRYSNGSPLTAFGIDGKSKTEICSLGDIEAIISPVDLLKYGSKEIAKNAKEDLKWIIKHAQMHERVIEEAMKESAVVPMKFGVVFKNKKNLEDTLHKNSDKFKKILKSLDGKEEWSVKIYVNEKKLKDEIKNRNKTLKKELKNAKKLPKGADYFKELEVEEKVNRILLKEIEKYSKSFFKALKSLAESARENKILSKEFVGKDDSMILNSAYLVKKDNIKRFKKKLKELESSNESFIFECTGPWPPYNFV